MQNTRLSSLDFDLGPEIDMLRTTVRGFAEGSVPARSFSARIDYLLGSSAGFTYVSAKGP